MKTPHCVSLAIPFPLILPLCYYVECRLCWYVPLHVGIRIIGGVTINLYWFYHDSNYSKL